MREIYCDGCGVQIDEKKVGNAVTLTWTHQDACGLACLKKILGDETAERVAFVARHGDSPVEKIESKRPIACAACEKGTPVTSESLHLHTGDGEKCRAQTLDEQLRRDGEEAKLAKLREEKPKPPKRQRKNGVTAPGPDVLHDLKGYVEENPGQNPNELTPEQRAEENRKFAERQRTHEPPRWCKCGKPATFNGKYSSLYLWECPQGHENVLENLLNVKQGQPGERIDSLHLDLLVRGVKVTVNQVAEWPVIRRDVARAMIAENQDLLAWHLSLEVPLSPPPEAPKQRFAF